MTNLLQREIHLPTIRWPEFRVPHLPLILFWLVLLLGVILRLYQFPAVPNGLNQDEMSAGYETWSLLHTGMDRWGDRWPAYFIAWGSGQNVLYSYLSLPFIALFGLTALGVRLVAVIVGIMLLPVLYLLVKRLYGTYTGLFAMLLVAVLPWQVMASRWALESNLLPFCLLLGVYTLTGALAVGARSWRRVVALLPFALALYAYGLGVTTVGLLLLLVLIVNHRQVRAHWRSWFAGVGLFLLLAAPFLLFFVKNYVLRSDLGFENLLPFSVPMLTETRLSELTAGQGGTPLYSNLMLIFSGFQDHTPWNSLVGHPPVPVLLVLFAVAEVIIRFTRFVGVLLREKRLAKPDIVSLWLIAGLPLLFIIQLNVNQANALILPVLILGACGVSRVVSWLPRFRRAATGLVVLITLISGLGAYGEYQGPAYATWSANNFNPGLQQAFTAAAQAAGNAPLYVSPNFSGNYVQTLWYLRVPPRVFQASKATPGNPTFGNFLFSAADLSGRHGYYALLRAVDTSPCSDMKVLRQINTYWVGLCV